MNNQDLEKKAEEMLKPYEGLNERSVLITKKELIKLFLKFAQWYASQDKSIKMPTEEECKHILSNDKQGMYVCSKCGISLEKHIQDDKENNGSLLQG